MLISFFVLLRKCLSIINELVFGLYLLLDCALRSTVTFSGKSVLFVRALFPLSAIFQAFFNSYLNLSTLPGTCFYHVTVFLIKTETKDLKF